MPTGFSLWERDFQLELYWSGVISCDLGQLVSIRNSLYRIPEFPVVQVMDCWACRWSHFLFLLV